MYRKQNQLSDAKVAECPQCAATRLMYSRGKLTCTNCGEVIGATFNKYGAKKTEYNGHRYDSKFESQIAQELDLRLKTGELTDVQRQVKIPLEAYSKHITNYYIDFVATHSDGHREYIEVKGVEQALWQLKWKMLEAKLSIEEPGAEMTLIKQRERRKVR